MIILEQTNVCRRLSSLFQLFYQFKDSAPKVLRILTLFAYLKIYSADLLKFQQVLEFAVFDPVEAVKQGNWEIFGRPRGRGYIFNEIALNNN